MTDQLNIRRATQADRDAIGRLWLEMMEYHRRCDPEHVRLRPDALEVWSRHLDDCLADHTHTILVAEAERELAGFAMGRPGEDPPVFATPQHGFVTSFAVADAWRRRGIGRRLFEALAAEFERQGFSEIRLMAWSANSVSNAFWRKMGFEPYSAEFRRGLGRSSPGQ